MPHELCIFYSKDLTEYGYDDPHPFSRTRLPAFWNEFVSKGLDRRVDIEASEICDEGVLEPFHTPEYIRFVKQASHMGTGYLVYGDTPALKGLFEAASRVVGTTLKALRLIIEGRYKRAFSALGGFHHARRDRAAGFAVFNDVGVAIEHLRQVYGMHRIAYVDIDVHHADGVFYAFEADPEVFIADIHEDGRFLYPGTGSSNETGSGGAKGTKLNLPMQPGASDEQFTVAFKEIEGFIDDSKPEIILLQSGADSLAGDPIAHLRFSTSCHRTAARRLRSLAEKHSQGRILALGGGGYELSNIAAAWCAVVEALI